VCWLPFFNAGAVGPPASRIDWSMFGFMGRDSRLLDVLPRRINKSVIRDKQFMGMKTDAMDVWVGAMSSLLTVI
jgi:hypothetical protein